MTVSTPRPVEIEMKKGNLMKIIAPDAGREISELIPEDEVHAAFLRREDIATLAPEQQAEAWLKHKEGLGRFFHTLQGVPFFVIEKG